MVYDDMLQRRIRKQRIGIARVKVKLSRQSRKAGAALSAMNIITPIRYRTTVLTDICGKTKDIRLTQSAAGHTKAAMTLKHCVRG